MMTFGWKRKLGSRMSKSTLSGFQDVTGQRDSDSEEEEEALHHVAKQQHLEDAATKSKRLKEEGMMLAEAERYWEAIKKWDEALELTQDDVNLLDMKAQVLLILHEVFPAAQVAEQVVKLNPRWWVGYQMLGRAQLGLGEVGLAFTSFSKAVHLNPTDEELWKEDLLWAHSLCQEKLKQERDNEAGSEEGNGRKKENNGSQGNARTQVQQHHLDNDGIQETMGCDSEDNGTTEDTIRNKDCPPEDKRTM